VSHVNIFLHIYLPLFCRYRWQGLKSKLDTHFEYRLKPKSEKINTDIRNRNQSREKINTNIRNRNRNRKKQTPITETEIEIQALNSVDTIATKPPNRLRHLNSISSILWWYYDYLPKMFCSFSLFKYRSFKFQTMITFNIIK